MNTTKSTRTRTRRQPVKATDPIAPVPTDAADALIWRLRSAGISYRRCAEELAAQGHPMSHEQVRRRWFDMLSALAPVDDVKAFREAEDERLDQALAVVVRIMSDQSLSADVRLRAVTRLVNISARRARMHGLDAPVQVGVEVDSLSGVAAEVEAFLAGITSGSS